jgi:ADP-heptose:LPS heptosyltransferase
VTSGSPPRRILVLSLDTYGDLLLRQPLLHSLLEEGHEVTVVVRRGYDALLPFLDVRLRPLVTDLNPYEAPGEDAWAEADRLRDNVAAIEPHTLVCAPCSWTWTDEWVMRQFPALERVGFRGADERASPLAALTHLRPRNVPPAPEPFSREVSVAAEAPESERNAALLRALVGREPATQPHLELPTETVREAKEEVRALGLEPGGYVLGCPAGTATSRLKAWPADSYADVLTHLWRRHGLPALLTGVKLEEAHLRAIATEATSRELRVAIWIGEPATLGRLLGLVHGARLYVGSDTATMHFAAALDLPVVARFGGGHWPRFLPLARRSFVATRSLPCFGCGWDCWLDEPMCVTKVQSQTLIEGIDWILSGSGEGRRVDEGPPFAGLEHELARSGAAAFRALGRDLRTALGTAEQDRAARLEVIERQESEIRRLQDPPLPIAARQLLKATLRACGLLGATTRIRDATFRRRS